MKKIIFRAYALGVLAGIFIISLIQDYLGLEEYIEFAREHWVDVPWGLWVVGLILIGYFYFWLKVRSIHFVDQLQTGKHEAIAWEDSK